MNVSTGGNGKAGSRRSSAVRVLITERRHDDHTLMNVDPPIAWQ